MVIENSFLLWILVGGMAGIVLGVAGTGGGVISIPLLMTFGGYDIKKASAYALLVLTVGAAISWFLQRKNTLYPVVGVLIFFAVIFAFMIAPLKALSPAWLINVLLNLTCLFSLYSLWILRKPEDPGEERPLTYRLKTATFGGMITGFLSTMTGLGGGVIIIPWLTGITRLRFEQAMACSLLTIFVIAPLSAWRQESIDLALEGWMGLVVSIVIMSLIVKKLTIIIPPLRLLLIRKLTLTGVIFLSMLRTLWVFF